MIAIDNIISFDATFFAIASRFVIILMQIKYRVSINGVIPCITPLDNQFQAIVWHRRSNATNPPSRYFLAKLC